MTQNGGTTLNSRHVFDLMDYDFITQEISISLSLSNKQGQKGDFIIPNQMFLLIFFGSIDPAATPFPNVVPKRVQNVLIACNLNLFNEDFVKSEFIRYH